MCENMQRLFLLPREHVLLLRLLLLLNHLQYIDIVGEVADLLEFLMESHDAVHHLTAQM